MAECYLSASLEADLPVGHPTPTPDISERSRMAARLRELTSRSPFVQSRGVPYVPDLAPATGGTFSGLPETLAVGWLAYGYPFPVGPVPGDAMARLRALHATLDDPDRLMVPAIAAGLHKCDLCSADDASHSDNMELYVRALDGTGFEAPAMIVHYIDSHAYRPPAAFIDAVLAAPTVASLIGQEAAAAAAARLAACDLGLE